MKKEFLLGFDVGTSESKGTICDFKGKVIATASSPHTLRVPKPGYAEHDPIKDWWDDFKKIVAELLDKSGLQPNQIAAIGISTIMAAITPVDRYNNPLRNAILYGIDHRAQKQVNDLYNEIGRENMLKKTGALVNNESFGPKIRWIRDNEPDIFNKTYKFTIASGFINAKLTGNYCVDRYSASSALPMYDTNNYCWNEELTNFVCRLDQLPDVVNTTDIIGLVTKEAAMKTGLCEGTPVICGTTDAGAEAVSVGVVFPGDMMIMYGSTMFIIYLTKDNNEIGLWKTPYTISGNYAQTSGMATTGSLLKWIRDQFCRDLLKNEKNGGENAFSAMGSEANNISPGSEGLIVLPYFLGERMPIKDPNAKGVIFGLQLNHTRGHIIKAAYEGIAYGLDQNLDILRKANLPFNNVISVGGGTKSQQWMQTISDVCGITQKVPEVTVGASYGDAMLAGIGLGVMNTEDIKNAVKVKSIIKPNKSYKNIYDVQKKYFKELYNNSADIMHNI